MNRLKIFGVLFAALTFVGGVVAQDESQAIKRDRVAAEQGLALAQHNLGVAYDKGDGVAKDSADAVRWFREAAEQGHVNARFSLGLVYLYSNALPLLVLVCIGFFLFPFLSRGMVNVILIGFILFFFVLPFFI